ncbi:hypothetical protein GX586_14515 [bacterium]|nr:hypothetical protein [bacterium]
MGTMKRFDAGFMRYKTRGVVFPPSIDYPDLSTLHADATGITADCSIGTIPLRAQDQPVPLEHKARFVYVTGWAIDQVAHRPAGGIHVVIDDTFIPVFIGARRDDIARAFSNPDYCHCGFVVAVPVTLIGPGSHHISVLFLNARRTAYSAFPFSAVVQIPGAR